MQIVHWETHFIPTVTLRGESANVILIPTLGRSAAEHMNAFASLNSLVDKSLYIHVRFYEIFVLF